MFLGEGDRLISNSNASSMRIPGSERIISIHKGIFIVTEFRLYKTFNDTLIVVPVPIRDRITAVLDEGEKLWVVQSRGVILLFNLVDLEYTFVKSFTLKESSSVFYSASIVRMNTGVLEIAFGTIFSGILITHLAGDEFKPVQSLEGHKGTIFDIKHHPCDLNILISCSDDRSVRVWKRAESIFESSAVLLGHEARVWSLDVQGESIASVSEDNTCRLWNLETPKLVKVFECDSYSKSIWSVSMNSTGNLLAFGSNDGSVILHDLSKCTKALLTDYSLPESFGNVKNLAACPDGTCFVATDKDFLVKITSNNVESIGQIEGINKFPSMIYSNGILYIADEFGSLYSYNGSDVSRITSISLNKKITRIFAQDDALLLESLNEIFLFLIEKSELCRIDLENGTKITSFLKFEQFLFIGTRQGTLLKYKNNVLADNAKISATESIKSIKRDIKSNCINLIDRSGVETILNINNHEIIEKNRLGKGTIESYFGSCSVASFHQHCFIISDSETGITDKIPCGGGHRLWDSSAMNNNYSFAYMSNGRLSVYSGQLDKVKLLSKRSHGKEIRCSHVINDEICLSGSEDGLLIAADKARNIETRLVNTSIKCITSISHNVHEHLVVVGGSNESIEVYKFNSSNFQLNHLASCPKQIDDIETRVLCLDVKTTFDDNILILAGYSDASIRIFEYDFVSFKLLRSLKNVHSKRCVQQIRFLCGTDKTIFISSGADGSIQAWDFEDYKELWNCKAHESGINAIDINGNRLLTGGEDGSIVHIELTKEMDKIENISTIKEAHNSTVTGVKFIGDSFVSASIDRFINIYDESCSLKQRKRTIVSDISSISLTNDHLIVYGAGIEAFKLQ